MRVLLVNPPLSGPEGPYPAICYLAGFLKTIGRSADLADVSLQLLRRLFSAHGVASLAEDIEARTAAGTCSSTPSVRTFLAQTRWYVRTIDTAVAAIEGFDRGAVLRARKDGYLPAPFFETRHRAEHHSLSIKYHESRLGLLTGAQRGRLFESKRPLEFAFGVLSEVEEARYRASLMLSNLVQVVRDAVDPSFSLYTYASALVPDFDTFHPLEERLGGPPNLLDRWVDELTIDLWRAYRPELIGISVPFPGSVLGAFRVARQFKRLNPSISVVMGGGWVNTALRDLTDPAVFDYVDYITLDDGERPLQCILEEIEGVRPEPSLLRTFVRRGGQVEFVSDPRERDIPFSESGTPTYAGLPLRQYLNYLPDLHSASYSWRGRWNKLTLAHGCYWKKCAFCDVHLDYIGRYSPSTVDDIIVRIKALVAETSESGFHFVDEAMPPAVMKRLAHRLIDDGPAITWWGNVRFDPQLAAMADVLAGSGCVRLTGGLEVASDRLLALMDKGVSLSQVAKVTSALSRAGIQVHAYLIYGFPTQTAQETVDALEYVRQLLSNGFVASVFWHRFSLTAHSPIAKNPAAFGVELLPEPPVSFARYAIGYREIDGIDHARFGPGLDRASESFMKGSGFEYPLNRWFDFAIPATTLPSDFVACLARGSAIVPAV